jgi:hypothetical protein
VIWALPSLGVALIANMKFAKRVFLVAGICGVLVLLPRYFFRAENQA